MSIILNICELSSKNDRPKGKFSTSPKATSPSCMACIRAGHSPTSRQLNIRPTQNCSTLTPIPSTATRFFHKVIDRFCPSCLLLRKLQQTNGLRSSMLLTALDQPCSTTNAFVTPILSIGYTGQFLENGISPRRPPFIDAASNVSYVFARQGYMHLCEKNTIFCGCRQPKHNILSTEACWGGTL